jgi:AcrR family transcriptional regulator
VPRPQLDAAQIAAFRERLTVIATRLFAEQGFEAVTMRSVAEAMGVSPMTSYRYVADKDELLALVRTAAFRRFADTQAQVSGAEVPARERLRALGQAYVEFALREPDAYRIMFELRQPVAGHPELDAEVERSFSYLLEAVRALVECDELQGDPLSLAHMYWASTHGLVSLHLAQKLTLGRDIFQLAPELALMAERTTAAKPTVVPAVGSAREQDLGARPPAREREPRARKNKPRQ